MKIGLLLFTLLLLAAPAVAQQNSIASGFARARWGDCAATNLNQAQVELALAIAPMSDRVRSALYSNRSDLVPQSFCSQQAHAQICTSEIVEVLKQVHLAAGQRGLSGGNRAIEEQWDKAKDLFDAIDLLAGRSPTASPNVGALIGGTAGAILGAIGGSDRGLTGLAGGTELGRRGGVSAGNALLPGLNAAACTRRLARMEQASEQFQGRPAASSADAVIAWILQQRVAPEHRQGQEDLRAAANNMRLAAPRLQAMLAR